MRCLAVLAVALVAASPAAAQVSEACRVPDVYLTMPELDRTERLVDRKAPIRLAIIGPELSTDGLPATPTLEQELERKLPGANVVDVGHRRGTGLAEDDLELMRQLVFEEKPDLVIWQVGTVDAIALSDVQGFEAALDEASRWSEARGIDLILVDPPFVPHVRHERIYRPYVGAIGRLSDEEEIPMLRRYAAMQYLELQREKDRKATAPRRDCTTELLAEAIARAALR